jgi:uncharacterized protein YdeI (BOF family)
MYNDKAAQSIGARFIMSGGFREGSGRKNPWASQTKIEDCKSIRVPGQIVDRLMQVAHYIDAGGEVNIYTSDEDATEKTISKEDDKLEKIIQIVELYKSKAHPTSVQWKKANELIKELEGELI